MVIDLQIGLVKLAWQAKELLAAHQVLLDWAAAQSLPIFYLQHLGKAGTPLEPNSPGWPIQPEILRPGYPLIQKTASDSFYQTDLAERLETLGVDTLILTGMKTERCVDTTARAAVSRGYEVIVIADAHSTTPNPILEPAEIIKFTNFNLQGFGNEHAQIRVLSSLELIHEKEAGLGS